MLSLDDAAALDPTKWVSLMSDLVFNINPRSVITAAQPLLPCPNINLSVSCPYILPRRAFNYSHYFLHAQLLGRLRAIAIARVPQYQR